MFGMTRSEIDEVVAAGVHPPQRLRSGRGGVSRVPGRVERAADEGPDTWLVVDDENRGGNRIRRLGDSAPNRFLRSHRLFAANGCPSFRVVPVPRPLDLAARRRPFLRAQSPPVPPDLDNRFDPVADVLRGTVAGQVPLTG